MGNKSTKKQEIIESKPEKTNEQEITELSEHIILSTIGYYYSNLNNQTLSNRAEIPKEICNIIIDYSFYFIVLSQSLIKLKKSLSHSTDSLQSQEAIFSLKHSIQHILKQIQFKYDRNNCNVNNEYIKFIDTNYDKYKNNTITMQHMTDISIDFIHNALITNCITRQDIGDFLTHWNTFNDNINNVKCYRFLYCYLRKHGLYKICKNPNKDLLDALKYFIRNCEFDFPAEARKIERLLEPFANIYCEMNSDIEFGIWNDSDNVFVSVNMLLMINTSFHNPRIKEKDRLTLQKIKGMCNGINTTNNEIYTQRMLQMATKIKECKLCFL
eukprot:477857_1